MIRPRSRFPLSFVFSQLASFAASHTVSLVVSSLSLLLGSALPAQGEFVNFETGGVKPIAVARVLDHDYLLVCNTPDNAIEIYDTIGPTFVTRVSVGLRPVTVAVHPYIPRFYTANFLGDSVSVVRMQPDGNGGIDVFLEWTVPVLDEPTDVGFSPDGLYLFVTQQSSGSVGWYDALFLLPIGGVFGQQIDMTFPLFVGTAARKALKEPRRILFTGTTMLVLGHKGDNSATFDFDMLSVNLATGLQTDIGGLGSVNFNVTAAPDGRVFAVGSMARNTVLGEPALRQEPTGFVQSHLYVIENVGQPSVSVRNRDLNLDTGGSVVPKLRAIAVPTDVAVLPDGADVDKVFVTGFSSDRIGILHPNAGAPSTWPMSHIELRNRRGQGYSRTGPRALALKLPAGASGDPGARLYSFNQLNHSVSVIDPLTESVVTTLNLLHDPTPRAVREGREFLYSAELSGNGFDACSSCHVDARTDNTVWVLGEITGGPGDPLPQELLDGVTRVAPPSEFPSIKGPMMTQDLQGLVTHPNSGDAGYLLSEAPYHWRGDRQGIPDFNGAFVTLMGAPNVGTAQDPRGITDSQMDRYVAMLETVMYPPNPRQPKDRRYSGTFGTPNQEDGTGAARGLKLYHILPLDSDINAGRSCVHCHALPDGSNQRISEFPVFQPLESAELRGLLQREARLEKTNAAVLGRTFTAGFGLTSTGEFQHSINSFIRAGFFPPINRDAELKLSDLIAFVRELDWGIAPVVGQTVSISRSNAGSPSVGALLDLMESSARAAEAGVAIRLVRNRGASHDGFWYDVTATPMGYRSVVDSTLRTRAQLLSQLQGDDLMLVQATEAGSERRVASLDGRTAPIAGPAPRAITLEPMVPGTPWQDVGSLTKNWVRGTGPNDFNWTGEQSPGVPAAEPISLKAMRIYQWALSNLAPGFGITRQGHEPPRRLRVAGEDIRFGARLELRIPAEPGVRPPYTGSERTQLLSLPLFPTDQQNAQGRRIWQTTAELDGFHTLFLLLGGPEAPGVMATRLGQVAEPPPGGTFDTRWNQFHVTVVNADGTSASGGWQTLTVQ